MYETLKRPELVRAAAERWPSHNWLRASNVMIREALTTGVVPSGMADETTNGSSGSLETAILNLVASHSGVSEERVRELVAEAVAELPQAAARILEVRNPEKPTVTIEGAHKCLERLVQVLSVRRHAYLVGPPGTGKTHLAHQAAEALGLPYYALSLSPLTTPSRVFGYCSADGTYVPSLFRQAYEHGGVFLLDEVDNGHAGILAEVNQAISNGHASFPDGMVARHPDFVLIAAANTSGTGATRRFQNRNRLDEATMDRFVELQVPIDEDLERRLALAVNPNAGPWVDWVQSVRRTVDTLGIEVFVTPRASIDGANLLLAGIPQAEVESMRVFKGLDEATVSRIKGAL